MLWLVTRYIKDVMSVRKFPPPQSRDWRYSRLRLTCSYANVNCTSLIYMWGASGQSNVALGGFWPCHNGRMRSAAEEQYIWAEREGCIHSGHCLWEPVVTKLYRAVTLILTLRRLTSYIYGAPILDVSRSHTTTQHSR